MARPDFVICLECESELEEFTWREGEIRRATCVVCGNADPDAFSLPEDYEQDILDEEDEPDEDIEEDEEEEDDDLDDEEEDE